MKLNIKSTVSGQIDWLEVRDKNGVLKARFENVKNLLTNGAFHTLAAIPGANITSTHYTFEDTSNSYEDLDGTWNQTGNSVTRATGTGTFPASPSQLGNELYWYDAGANTGHRCHVSARTSDTAITVTGAAKTITGGKIRRFKTIDWSSTGNKQSSSTVTLLSTVTDLTAGTHTVTVRASFGSASAAYTLGSIVMYGNARVKLPATVAIEAEDQLQYQYTVTETCTGRSQDYELGAEAAGLPQKYTLSSIVGNGTYVDVTFTGATIFAAGDKLDLRGVVPKRFAISSASSTSTTFTINTTTAHGLSVGNSVVIENASLAGYNGTHTVATVPSSTQITITNASNPGAMGAAGTVRRATPASYFDSLSLATIASMPSSSVARITSAVTGPAVDTTATVGGDPGVKYRCAQVGSNKPFRLEQNPGAGWMFFLTEANVKAIYDITTVVSVSITGYSWTSSSQPTFTTATYTNDFTCTFMQEKAAGAGTDASRLKQVIHYDVGSGMAFQITFNTPFSKTTAQRLRVTISKQIRRELDLTGLP